MFPGPICLTLPVTKQFSCLVSLLSLTDCCLGIFFVMPCIESYQKVDLRTITLGVPPQEVRKNTELTPAPDTTPCRCWPRTVSRCRWTRWSTTGSVMPPWAWPTWRTPTTAPGCCPRPLLGTSSAPRIFTRSSVTERVSLELCRWSYWELNYFPYPQLLWQAALDEATEPWGIKVERVEM